jgi:hypothetical protein
MYSDSSTISPVFYYSKNYIRFWNYQTEDQDLLLELLNSCEKEVTAFSHMQENIYLSCGMPTRFKIGFAIAYRQFANKVTLKQRFETLQLSHLKDFYDISFKEKISFFERAAALFSDGFEVRFTRNGPIEVIEVLQELSFIMNSFKLPFFCYHFTDSVGANRRLDMFMK